MTRSKSQKTKAGRRQSGSIWTRITGGRALEITILVVFGLVVLYVASMSIRLANGVSKTLPVPEHEVRLQVLNGCGVKGLAARVSDRLVDYGDENFRVAVVDTDNFDLHEVQKSFVISRFEDDAGARLLAEKLGLDPQEVLVQPLTNNYRQISASLVLGQDWERLQLVASDQKEQ
ncbi:MAG: LytR C-terminal domain-containing protein [bacterium]